MAFLKSLLYKKTINKNGDVKRKYLCGLIKTLSSIGSVKIFVLGFNIAQMNRDAIYNEFFLRTPVLYRKKNFKNFLNALYKQSPSECDSIVYVSVPTGEAYLIANIMDSLFTKYKLSNPYILCRNRIVYNIIKLYKPEIPAEIYEHPNDHTFRLDCKYFYKYKGKKVFILFPKEHYYRQDCQLLKDKTGEKHFFEIIKNSLGLSGEPINYPVAHYNASDKENLLNKISSLNLNLNKFVIFAPEANSCLKYSESFWKKLYSVLTDEGYDVFWNVMSEDSVINDMKKCRLTHAEICILAEKSRAVVSLRSGLTDLLSGIPVDKFILYTDIPYRSKTAQFIPSSKVLTGFSLKRLPNANQRNIFEYDTQLLDGSTIIEDIKSKLEVTDGAVL